MLFIYIITAFLVILALSSLKSPSAGLYITFALGGFITSWGQQKTKNIPYLKLILNILLISLTVKAFLPFFINKPSDLLTDLIKTLTYFLILSTYTIYSQRDYYLIHTLSLGLIVFSCFYTTTKSPILLGYILSFFVVWIIALRWINLLQGIEETKDMPHKKERLWWEFKISIAFAVAVIALSLPLYLLLPRFNAPLPFISRFLGQKVSLIYTDFPRRSIISFLSPSKKGLTGGREEKEQTSKVGKEFKEGLLELDKTRTKPIFWHGPEEYEEKLPESEKEREKKQAQKEFFILHLLFCLLIISMSLLLLYLIYWILAFFLPYLKEKKRIRQASSKQEFHLSIALLYNFLCRVLVIFGYRYPVVIDPEEHSNMLIKKFKNVQRDCNLMISLFLEARYSSHKFIKEQEHKAINCYRNIWEELKRKGSFWQKAILKLFYI